MPILAIDPGRKFGWAILQGKTVQASGVLELSDDIGAATLQIQTLLDDIAVQCDAVWCESRPFSASSNRASEWAGAIRGAVSFWSAGRRLPYGEVSPQTWKAKICGMGDLKPVEYTAFLSRVLRRDLRQDEAAAIGIGLYGATIEQVWRRQTSYRVRKGAWQMVAETPAAAVAGAVVHGLALPVEVVGYTGDVAQIKRRLWR